MAKMLMAGISSPNLLVIPTMPRFLALITIAIAVVCFNHASAGIRNPAITPHCSSSSLVSGETSLTGAPLKCAIGLVLHATQEGV